jgi:hypothetical protein
LAVKEVAWAEKVEAGRRRRRRRGERRCIVGKKKMLWCAKWLCCRNRGSV